MSGKTRDLGANLAKIQDALIEPFSIKDGNLTCHILFLKRSESLWHKDTQWQILQNLAIGLEIWPMFQKVNGVAKMRNGTQWNTENVM